MKHTIALIGGTGKVGRHIAKQAVEYGYHVKMLVRNLSSAITHHPSIEIVQGDAFDDKVLDKLFANTQLVINTFGQPVQARPSYSKLMQKIISAMNDSSISTYIGVTGASLTLRDDQKSKMNKAGTLLFQTIWPAFMADKEREVQLLQNSSLDWTMVRLPFVIECESKKQVKVHFKNPPGMTITNSTIASFLLTAATHPLFHRKMPFISN